MVRSFIQAMPKVELHVHLEGALRPSTVLRLFRKHGNPKRRTAQEVEQLFVHRDFREFLLHYQELNRWVRSLEDVETITVELLQDLAAQNVRYAEVTVSPTAVERLSGLEAEPVLLSVLKGYERARAQVSVEMGVIVDLVRNFGVEEGWRMVRIAAQWQDEGVVGITLGGNEFDFPAAPYAPIYSWAREQGLRATVHAGEWAGPESVWSALRDLGTERIGHGVRMVEDPALCEEVVARGLHVECCPTSNVATGAVASWQEHPIRRLHDQGVRLSVNSDDPTLFRTTLTRELELLHEVHGFTPSELLGVMGQAIDAAFLPDARRQALREELSRYGAEALGGTSPGG